MTLFFLFIATATFIPVHSFANNYYVSPSGNNFNSGTLKSPFRTISYGETKLKGGDTLYIRSGTYSEIVRILGVQGGTENRPTVISAYNDEQVIIDGRGLNVGLGSALVRSSNNYTQFIGLTVINSNQAGIMLDREANHSKIIKCITHDTYEGGIGVYGDYGFVEYCTVYNACLSNSDGIYTPPEVWNNGIDVRGSNGSEKRIFCTIRYNIVHDVWGEGISTIFSDHAVIEDNIIYDIYNVLLYSRNSQNGVFQRNLIYMTKQMGNGSSVGIGHWNEGNDSYLNKNNTFINNIVFGGRRNFYSYASPDNLQISNNTFVNSTYSVCIQINNRSTAINSVFTNNIVIQEDGLPVILADKGTGLTFSHNLYNKDYDADAVGAGDIVGDPKLTKTGSTGAGKLTAEYFKLQGNSPAINKAGISGIVNSDFFNNPRDNYPDIGAVEYYSVEPDTKVTYIIVSGDSDSTALDVGATLQLNALVLPYNATNKNVGWSIVNGSGQAVINSSGILTAISPGTVTVKAMSKDGSDVFGILEIKIVITCKGPHQMLIYPNPAQNYFHISMQNPPPVPMLLRISTITGKILQENKINADLKEFQIHVGLLHGIYIVQLYSNRRVFDTKKLIIDY